VFMHGSVRSGFHNDIGCFTYQSGKSRHKGHIEFPRESLPSRSLVAPDNRHHCGIAEITALDVFQKKAGDRASPDDPNSHGGLSVIHRLILRALHAKARGRTVPHDMLIQPFPYTVDWAAGTPSRGEPS